jgi:methionyl-tRNA formyltransferase
MLQDVVLLGAETARTEAYLRSMIEHELEPPRIILVHAGEPTVLGRRIVDVGRGAGIELRLVAADNMNAPSVVEALDAGAERYAVFSGMPGAIVRRPLFDTGKRFIHVHPGRLPEFRGSTTIYYSLLERGVIDATAIILDEGIDSGPVIGEASFAPPDDLREIDSGYDAQIRATLLVSVLRDYAAKGYFDERAQSESGATNYYIIHPVLKHLAILNKS